MNRVRAFAFWVLLLSLALPASTWAQARGWRARNLGGHASDRIHRSRDLDRVQGQLDRTREMIDNAAPRMATCNVERAQTLLRTARAMQRRAEDANGSGHPLAALQLTMGARERVERSLRQCNLPVGAGDPAERALRRTDEVIQRAQEAVGERGSGNARELVARAVELQSRAQDEFRGGHAEACARLTLSARALAQRAARVAVRGS